MVQQGEILLSRAQELQAARRSGASATRRSRALQACAVRVAGCWALLARFSSQPSPRWGSLGAPLHGAQRVADRLESLTGRGGGPQGCRWW